MKSYILFLIFVLVTYNSYSQDNVITEKDLTGIWQAELKDFTSMWLDSYAFFENGRFIFRPSPYDGLQRIIEIKGKYTIGNNELVLTTESTKEKIGGKIIRSRNTTLSDSWEIINYKTKQYKINSEPEILMVDKCSGEPEYECILIDGRKYYKMRNEPENY